MQEDVSGCDGVASVTVDARNDLRFFEKRMKTMGNEGKSDEKGVFSYFPDGSRYFQVVYCLCIV